MFFIVVNVFFKVEEYKRKLSIPIKKLLKYDTHVLEK